MIIVPPQHSSSLWCLASPHSFTEIFFPLLVSGRNYFHSKMLRFWWLLSLALMVTMPCLQAVRKNDQMIIRTETFLSPLFTLTPGSVVEKFYYNLNFPKGHIAIKSFDVEVVDEAGNPVSLSETYIHHWAIVRYYQHENAADPNTNITFAQLHEPDFILPGNNGVCQKSALPYYYAMGSESRKTSTFLPDPYGIEVGDAAQLPQGYEERWCLNVHAIDTRGVEDRLGCIECRCHLYNVTKDPFGVPLNPDYKGGFRCCYEKTQCRVSQSYKGEERSLYARYTVTWVDWNDYVLPVKVYIFDVTDTWKPLMGSTGPSQEHRCLVEYDVEESSSCNATKRLRVIFPDGGFLVYGVGHQHIGGVGATLYGEDGRVLCSSSPIYGVGNEDGYVVGMSTCYPQLGYMKIDNGEMVTLESNYDSTQNHTGVMGIFQIMVADKLPKLSLRMEPSKVVVGETTM